MGLITNIGITANIIWAITLLIIIRTVRLQNFKLVNSAVEGNVWLGTGDIDISWFWKLYKSYVSLKGYNFLLTVNLISLLTALVSVSYIVISTQEEENR